MTPLGLVKVLCPIYPKDEPQTLCFRPCLTVAAISQNGDCKEVNCGNFAQVENEEHACTWKMGAAFFMN